MSESDGKPRRVRFYGAGDLAAGWYAPRAAELAAEFSADHALTDVMHALELHNVRQYLEHRLLPTSCSGPERDLLVGRAPQIRAAVARFFASVDSSNFAEIVSEVGYEFHGDLLELLGRSKAFERCSGETALSALKGAGVHLHQMLASSSLVQAYDTEMRGELQISARGAEYLVRKYLEKGSGGAIYLPRSFTSTDAHNLLERYIDDGDANLNYVRLISTANDNALAGIDAKLRLRAKRRSEELNAEIFEQNAGFKTGCELIISDDQEEPSALEVDSTEGSILRYTYSKRWLDDTLDNPSILNNFQHLFGFIDHQALLTLPAYPSQFGVMERVMGVTGNEEYKIGVVFRNSDASSLLQTHMYRSFLKSNQVDLEQVISWFFEKYLVDEFEMANFSFAPSEAGGAYLQKVRHLFAEMESVANQFALFVENDELDRDLLSMGSDQVRYKELPSALVGKYVYPAQNETIAGVLYLLFSDQSGLGYIREELHADNAVELLLRNEVRYASFDDYQKLGIDRLIDLGVLENTGGPLRFVSMQQLSVFKALFETQAANYYHLSAAGRREVDAMIEKGWLVRRSSLLTWAEADYFNYFLNKAGFSNGPNLRNRYLHGSQPPADSDAAHFETYLIALRLMVALVLKINDDVSLAAIERSQPER